jgi:predicted nucleic acid-binding protein
MRAGSDAEHPEVCARAGRVVAPDEAAICVIVRGEILYGIERLPVGQRRASMEDKARLVLSQMRCYELSLQASDHFARIKAQQQRIGFSLNDDDLWIAASCAEFGATLVSRDRDFSRIAGFAVEDWSK